MKGNFAEAYLMNPLIYVVILVAIWYVFLEPIRMLIKKKKTDNPFS